MASVRLATDQRTTTLRDGSGAELLPALQPALPRAARAQLEALGSTSRWCVAPQSANGRWRDARRRVERSSKLTIGVLGCSTTAGCGALSPRKTCSLPLSWARHMHDGLATALRPQGVAVDTSIFHKNAVEASFFLDCTSELLPPRPDVVVLEMLQNFYSVSDFASALNVTVRAIHGVAPDAAIVVAVWLKLDVLHTSAPRSLPSLAASMGFDLANAPQAMTGLRLPLSDVYAMDETRQDHHPSAAGHELVGALMAHCIARRLASAASSPVASSSGDDSDDGSRARAGDGGGRPSQSSTSERCFGSADALPVRSAAGFVLQDDGAAKGVKKLGWSSRTIGDRLTVGPLNLALPDARGCWANVRVRLGYLVSTSPGMGLLRANCRGDCKCRSVVSRFLQLYLPFPLLEGNARRQRSLTVSPDETITMTALTNFIAMPSNVSQPRSCYLVLEHRESPANSARNRSRVRVDTLALLGHGRVGEVPCPAERLAR